MRHRIAPAIENIISALVVGSLAFAFFPSGVVPRNFNIIYQLVEQYKIVGVILVLLSIPAILRLIVNFRPPEKRFRIRSITNFTFAVGYLFFTSLSIAAFGIFQVNWLNSLSLSAISAVLFVNSRSETVHGQQ
jgi:membrane protease YdiL (CAAX protease family)